jgi:Helix-turn-helix domain
LHELHCRKSANYLPIYWYFIWRFFNLGFYERQFMINSNTQAGRLLEHLENGGTITSLEAYQQLGITQLAARLTEIEAHGFKLNRKWIDVENRFKESCRVVQYSLLKELAAA